MATIFFPPDDDLNGLSCETYSFGWTSGCVDPNTGLNRGFTQEWYYEEKVGAWIAIGPDATGGADLENAGDPYDAINHPSVPYVTNVSGDLRKFALLDPDTGAITFDYIKFPDLVNPNEIGQFTRTNLTWTSPNLNGFDSEGGEIDYGVNGTTLCSDGTYTYVYYTPSSIGVGFVVSFNTTTPDNNIFSPLSIGPSGGTGVISHNTDDYAYNNENIVISGNPSIDLPKEVSISNGRNEFGTNEFYFGFTFNGPSSNAAGLDFTHWDYTTNGYITVNVASRVVKLENYWYLFAGLTANASDITETDIKTTSAGNYGVIGMLNPTSGNANHSFNITVPPSQLNNNGEDITNRFLYFAVPTRTAIDPGFEIYFNPTTSAGGFSRGSSTEYRKIQITNQLGYEEEYELFRAQQQGVDSAGLKIQTQ